VKDETLVTGGVGKCSVPMWCAPGIPAGFCNKPAYGKPPPTTYWRDAHTGEQKRMDGRYHGYVPNLACSGHGGPKLIDVLHEGDPCKYCGTPHDEVPIGPCDARASEWAGHTVSRETKKVM